MRLERRDLHFIVLVALAVLALLTGLTGLVSSVLDLHLYRPFRIFALFSGLLLLIYIILRWPFFMAYIRERLFHRDVQAAHDAEDEVVTPPPIVTRRGFIYRASAAGVFGAFAGMILGRVGRAGEQSAREFRQGEDPGRLFHRRTYLKSTDLVSATETNAGQWWVNRPAPYNEYPDAVIVPLDKSYVLQGGMTLEDAINRRRSRRDFSGGDLTLKSLSTLLHFTAGETARLDMYGQTGMIFRAQPSQGGLYPVEVYVIGNRVEGLDRGIYYFNPTDHTLRTLRSGDFRGDIAAACASQGFCRTASAVLVLTGVHDRAAFRGNERGYRNILLEAGHIAQNAYLAAEAMGLGACAVSTFYDQAVNDLLQLNTGGDPEVPVEEAVYVVAVGTV